MEVADTVIITNRGKVEQIGTPKDICLHPHTDFLADFIDASCYAAIMAVKQSYFNDSQSSINNCRRNIRHLVER